MDHHNGRVYGALGSSLGSSFVGQLMMRKNIHIDHAIFGSPDLDQCGIVQAKLQTMLFVPILTGTAKKKYRRKQHEQWLFGDMGLSEQVLNAIDEFMVIEAK
ncbi:MAG: hypothetical protein K6A76_02005 [Oribacterium sp.]|nr:hypothetical protein [Oribacterium sp.]